MALQGLAAVLGGTQSLHTDSYDEALALPTAEAARIALRTQQVIAYESGVANTIDPLAGSYFVERLTLDMENGAFAYFDKLDAMGGMVKAIERGFPQKEIAEASYQFQKATEAREKITVGANEFVIEEEPPIDSLHWRGRGRAAEGQVAGAAGTARQRGGAAGAGGAEARGGHDAGCGRETTEKFPRRTPCPTSWTRCGPMRRWARSAPRCARFMGRTRSRRLRRSFGFVAEAWVFASGRVSSLRQRFAFRNRVGRGIMRGEYFTGFFGDRRTYMANEGRIRVLVAKPGLDGHDRGAKVIARALRDAGMEVIYTGLRQTPEMVVNAALQEDVDVIGLSILSGAHNAIVPRVAELMKEQKMDDVLVLVGGIIPDQDIPALKAVGVKGVFQPGTPMDEIVKFIRENVKPRGVTA